MRGCTVNGNSQKNDLRRMRRVQSVGSVCGGFEKFHGITDRENFLSGVIGNLASEFFFECHDKLDSVEAVGAEVIDEARAL